MRRNGKKGFSLALSVTLVLGLFSGTGSIAVASTDVAVNTTTNVLYDDVSTALNDASNGETIEITGDVTPSNSIVYDRSGVSVTLDLNGHSIIRNAGGAGGETEISSAVYVEAGTLTIQDTSNVENGFIKYDNTWSAGSGVNVGASGTVNLLSGAILGSGQGLYLHAAGGRFNMSGGLLYGYTGGPGGAEALCALADTYVTISGGYVGKADPAAAMVWSASALNSSFWDITGGYFTSNTFSDGTGRTLADYVTQGKVTDLNPTLSHPLSGATEYQYHLTTPRTITFDANGGSVSPASDVTGADGKLSSLPNATKGQLTFKGWYTAYSGGTKITTDYIFNKNTTVYAQYQGGANHAPELTNSEVWLNPVRVNNANSAGTSVSELVNQNVDADNDVLGIAVIGQDLTNGTWEYYNAGSWTAWPQNTEEQALLLDSTEKVRFKPNADFIGESSLSFRLWDGTDGAKNTTADTTVNGSVYAYSSDIGTARIKVVSVEQPVLTAVGDNANNMVKLNWTSSLAGEEYYMVYQKDAGGDGLDQFQSIPLKKDIKVLNVYPHVGGSDGLQSWMQTYGNPQGYTMQVDKVDIVDFNGSDPSVNYTHYLTKNQNGSYDYDVLYFGAWDVNSGYDLSEQSHEAVESFVKYGGGVLVGHDTASFMHTYFIDLAQKYLNMDVKFQEGYPNPSIPTLGSNEVVIQRRGFPMNYPYALGDVGTVLNTPTSHSYFQFAKGDVWFKYNRINWGAGPEITSYLDQTGTNNFYLTTWNNAAMIQTGHSNGQATEDEQKILANTLFYLAQTSTANSFDDRMSQDVAAPNAVTDDVTVSPGSSSSTKTISWSGAADNGSSYSYYLKAISYVDGSSRESAETTATVTTGIKGYAVTVDTNPSNVDPGNSVTTSTNSYEVDHLESGVTYYAHIKAIDNAGNTSAVYTVPFTTLASGLTVESTDPSGKINNGKTKLNVAEPIGQGNKLVYLNAGSGTITVPGIGDELGEYQELPADGLVAAANGDKIAVAEVDATGKVVRFGQTVAKVAPSADELAVVSVDPAGVENNGKTQLVAGSGNGNKLVYVNFGKGEVTEPSQGEIITGYTDLPDGGIVDAARGDKMGVAEVDKDGKVVRFGVTEAKVSAEAEAKGLTATATDPSGAGTDGKTRVAVSAAAGNKLMVVNFKKDAASIPDTGSSISGFGYSELPAGGLVDAEDGDVLGIAEVDPAGNVVRYVTVPAVVAPDTAAKGLAVGTKDAAGEGQTQITGSVGEGHKLVYLNFGEGPVTAPTAGQPAGGGYVDVPAGGAVDARNGDILGVAEVDKDGNVVKFGTTRAVVTPETAAKGLPVAATDAAGSAADGSTKIVSKAAEGNKLVYVNFGEGPVNVPGEGETLSGYTELPASGIIGAKPGDKVGVAEIGPDGKVVKFGVTEAVVKPEKAAKTLPAVSTDPTGADNDGKTQLGTAAGITVGAGNKLVYLNAGPNTISIPEEGTLLSGYSELPVNGLVDAMNGDNIGLAEVDATGKVVRFGITKAAVEPEAAAKGLSASTTDPAGAGTDGFTQLVSQTPVGEGNKLVYLNFGKGAVLKPNVGDSLNGYTSLPEGGLIEADNGDVIGLAEVDADGKVVKFGVAEAVSYTDKAAKGLSATISDPAGSDHDDKTLINAQAEAGNKLVYVNFGTGQAIIPETGEILAGYSDLPASGLVPAVNGDRIALAEVDAAGRVIRFVLLTAVVSPYVESGSGGGTVSTPVTSTPVNNTKGVEVLVNGKIEYAGTATVTSSNGQTLTTIDVDQGKLQAKLDAEGKGAIVTIPWPDKSDIIIGQLTGQMIQNMEDKDATLVLDTLMGAYKIPTEQLRISSLAGQLGSNVKLEDVVLQVRIALAPQQTIQAAESATAQAGVTLMGTPVTFSVNAEYAGKSIEITDYSVYVERTVALPAGVDPNHITTGVVLEKDGTLRHVPTKVSKINELYYAQINSLTNSDYGVIWNPVEFSDVANHWSKNAVNDMGSRLVVNGVGNGKFNPDADITRAEFAAIMVRGLGLRLDKGAVPFTDVADSDWYASAVNTAYSFGLITGYEDGTFRPQARISRQEAMTILARAMQTTGLKKTMEGKDLSRVLSGFTDAAAVANWAKEGVTLSVAAQIVNGRTASTLESGAFITRAEVAAIMQRLLQKSGLI